MTKRNNAAKSSTKATRGTSKKESRGERNIRWIETYCRIPEGKFVGQRVKLVRFQKRIIKKIYDSPTRRAIISFGRKNAKTTLSAFLLLLHLCGPEAKPNSQLYSTAQSREQAAILFGLAAKVVRMSPMLDARINIKDTGKQLVCPKLGTVYRALSADASTAYGLSPIFTVHDELGQVRGPKYDLYDAIETASAAQDAPLSIIISTQAPTDIDLLSLLIDDAKTGADKKTKLFLYTADPKIDTFSVEAIKQANPGFDHFMNKAEVMAQAENARRMPSAQNSFENLILNRRVSETTPFIARPIWESCADEIIENVFLENPVYMGLDLSSKNDLSALAMIAQDAFGIWHAKVDFFAPFEHLEMRAKRDKVPYDLWADAGYITLVPGASVDTDYIAERLDEYAKIYNVVCVSYDRWRIDVLMKSLKREGLELELSPFGQGFRDMGPAVDTFETILLNTKIAHGSNPVLNWCAANAIAIKDPAGNRKLDKSKSTGRIDGIIALLMAFGRTTIDAPDTSLNDFLMAI